LFAIHCRAALVYVCAFLPGNGDSAMSWASPDRESMVNPSVDLRADGTIGFKPERGRETFYGNCAEADAAFAQSRLVAEPMAPSGSPVETTAERWGSIPRCNARIAA
jgi:hypothetical protein